MLRELFHQQRALLNDFFDRLDISQADKIFEKLRRCRGIVLLSGVGKSGHIAQKISATLSSTGTRSSFLSPSDALHGDVGFVSPEDIFLFFSKSGESEELFHLLPHIQKKGVFTIGCVSASQSRLAKACELAIVLPIQKELCPFDLAPTTSTAAQLIFGDCLAIGLMWARGFSQGDFAANHPAGFLGRKITLKVADLMLKEEALPFCRADQKLIETIHELSSKRCGCLLVVNGEKRLLGIFTDGDLRRAIESKGANVLESKIETLMNRAPKTIQKEELAFQAMRFMEQDQACPITVLPVIEQEKLVGLLRMHDILQAGLH